MLKFINLTTFILMFIDTNCNSQTITFTYDQNKNMVSKVETNSINKLVLNTNDIGAGSLREIITDACPEDTIKFSPSLASQTILLTGSEIKLSKPLYILGLGMNNLTISSENTGRIFNIDHDVVLGIEGVKLIKGESQQDGGALLNISNDLILKNVSFEQNKEGMVDKAFTNKGKASVIGDVIIKQ